MTSGDAGKVIVIKDHIPFCSPPLQLKTGDKLTATERTTDQQGWLWCESENKGGAWIPENYLSIEKTEAVLLCDYNSTELEVNTGEELTAYKEESGWLWCSNNSNMSGWVPKENVKAMGHR